MAGPEPALMQDAQTKLRREKLTMKTLTPSLFVSAALAGLLAAAVPASADNHEGKMKGKGKEHKAKKEKKAKGQPKMAAGDEKVHCLGVNACKGKSECAVEGGHACAGHNACKGKGWVTLARKDCAAQKGTVHGEKAAPAAEAPERAAKPAKAEKPAEMEKPAEAEHKH
jgi:hypothetical protein